MLRTMRHRLRLPSVRREPFKKWFSPDTFSPKYSVGSTVPGLTFSICDLSQSDIILQAGAMQWTVGNVNATTGVKGVGDLFGKAIRGSVTGESAIKPEYTGNGTLVLDSYWERYWSAVNDAARDLLKGIRGQDE